LKRARLLIAQQKIVAVKVAAARLAVLLCHLIQPAIRATAAAFPSTPRVIKTAQIFAQLNNRVAETTIANAPTSIAPTRINGRRFAKKIAQSAAYAANLPQRQKMIRRTQQRVTKFRKASAVKEIATEPVTRFYGSPTTPATA
jgi:hypothetical protein